MVTHTTFGSKAFTTLSQWAAPKDIAVFANPPSTIQNVDGPIDRVVPPSSHPNPVAELYTRFGLVAAARLQGDAHKYLATHAGGGTAHRGAVKAAGAGVGGVKTVDADYARGNTSPQHSKDNIAQLVLAIKLNGQQEDVDALSQISAPEAMPTLILAANDECAAVSRAASAALIKIGTPAVVEFFVSIAKKDNNHFQRAVDSLISIGTTESLNAAMTAITGMPTNWRLEDETFRSAIEALIPIGTLEVVTFFVLISKKNTLYPDAIHGLISIRTTESLNTAMAIILHELKNLPQMSNRGIEIALDCLVAIGTPKGLNAARTAIIDCYKTMMHLSYYNFTLIKHINRIANPEFVEDLILLTEENRTGPKKSANIFVAESLVKIGTPRALEAAEDILISVLPLLGVFGSTVKVYQLLVSIGTPNAWNAIIHACSSLGTKKIEEVDVEVGDSLVDLISRGNSSASVIDLCALLAKSHPKASFLRKVMNLGTPNTVRVLVSLMEKGILVDDIRYKKYYGFGEWTKSIMVGETKSFLKTYDYYQEIEIDDKCRSISFKKINGEWYERSSIPGAHHVYDYTANLVEEAALVAIKNIGLSPSDLNLPLLDIAIQSSVSSIRNAGIEALTRFNSPSAIPYLAPVATQDGESKNRLAAVVALARFNTPETVIALTHVALNDADEKLCLAATNALSKIGIPEIVVQALASVAIQGKQWEVLKAAVTHLGSMGTEEAIHALKRLQTASEDLGIIALTTNLLTPPAPTPPVEVAIMPVPITPEAPAAPRTFWARLFSD